jgi:hypothetical protein
MGVADFRVVEHVIPVVIVRDFPSQLVRPLLRCFFVHESFPTLPDTARQRQLDSERLHQ